MPAVATRHKFSVDQYVEMIDAGVLTTSDHVELIEGEIIEMAAQELPHVTAIALTNRLLINACPSDHYLLPQCTLPLAGADAPEPDFALIKGELREHQHFRPDVVKLIVEVSDTSLRFDRTTKVRVYARHLIPEYWIVNIPDRVLEVYREPVFEDYRTKATFAEGEEFTPLFNSELKIAVSDLIPAA